MPLMYAQNTLQMEWCLNCHRNPAKNLRPTSEIYNMAWEAPSESRPVWCSAAANESGVPTAQSVNCVTQDPTGAHVETAALELPAADGAHGMAGDVASGSMPAAPVYRKFTSQEQLGLYLVKHYNIRTPRELSSCEVCHR